MKGLHRPFHEWLELPEPPSYEALFTDAEFVIEYFNALCRNTFWGGEAMPVWYTGLGYAAHGHPKVRFFRNTVWLEEYGGIFSACWGPGRTFPLQCDFSIMISPEHFREFVKPELTFFANWSDRTKYHLDGEGALRHLPAVLVV